MGERPIDDTEETTRKLIEAMADDAMDAIMNCERLDASSQLRAFGRLLTMDEILEIVQHVCSTIADKARDMDLAEFCRKEGGCESAP